MRFFHTVVGSFHSAPLYRQVRREASFNMGYTLLLVLLCTLALTIYVTLFVHREIFTSQNGRAPFFDDIMRQIASQTPVMTYKDKQLQTQTPAATTITISGTAFGQSFSDLPIITVDTTGETTHENMKTPVLFTSNELIYKSDKETKIKSLSELTEDASSTTVINRAVAEDMANRFITAVHEHLVQFYVIIGGICWLMFAVFAYIMRIFMLLALGLGGLLAGSLFKSPLSYASSVSLAAVSFTPIAILETVLTMCFGYSPHIITTFVAGLVALTAAITCSREPVPMVTA